MYRIGRNDDGFTLLEMLVVLTLLSIVAFVMAVGMPNLRERTALARADTWLVALLSDLREQARREGSIKRVEFDMTAQRYRTQGSEWHSLPMELTWSLEEKECGEIQSPILEFRPDGTGTGTGLKLNGKVLQSVLCVDWLTGSIRHADG